MNRDELRVWLDRPCTTRGAWRGETSDVEVAPVTDGTFGFIAVATEPPSFADFAADATKQHVAAVERCLEWFSTRKPLLVEHAPSGGAERRTEVYAPDGCTLAYVWSRLVGSEWMTQTADAVDCSYVAPWAKATPPEPKTAGDLWYRDVIAPWNAAHPAITEPKPWRYIHGCQCPRCLEAKPGWDANGAPANRSETG